MIKLYTIGFTKKTSEIFFNLLINNNIEKLIDIRESNTNIYAGFTMKQNFSYFLDKIAGIKYVEMKELAPFKDHRVEYHKDKINNWDAYENNYLKLLDERKVKSVLSKELLNNSVLLCSEPTPEKCHRRLAAQYIKSIFKDVEIIHL